MKTLTVHLCRKTLGERAGQVSFDDQADVIEVDAENKTITTKIIERSPPDTCRRPIRRLIQTYLLSEAFGGVGGVAISECNPGCFWYDPVKKSYVRWDRARIVGEDTIYDTYPIIEYYNPDHCHWFRTEFLVDGPPNVPEDYGEGLDLLAFTEPDAPNRIPDQSDPDSQFTGSTWTEYILNQNVIVPGMRMLAFHWFNDRRQTSRLIGSYSWEYLCTCCLTGGTILARVGEVKDPLHFYIVGVEGIAQKGVPSDFIDWQVGDWVYLLPMPVSDDCQDVLRKAPCKAACGKWHPSESDRDTQGSRTFMIIPLKIWEYGA